MDPLDDRKTQNLMVMPVCVALQRFFSHPTSLMKWSSPRMMLPGVRPCSFCPRNCMPALLLKNKCMK